MRILAISDPHGDYSKIAAIQQRAGAVDLVLIAGDITNFGPAGKARELLDMFEQPTLAVPGNCDPTSIMDILDETRAVNLHNASRTIGDGDRNITFIGLGGSNPTPFNTPFELSEEEIEHLLEPLLAEAGRTPHHQLVLLTHAPPRGTVDTVPAGNVGSPAIANFLGRVDLIVCGHIHEARGVVRQNGTVVVNPGMVAQGYAALIDIEKRDAGNIDVELIQV
ncbi:MAG: metallophosphoesterase [Euryarchaeota archaeon]|nr:metallophosphoesterase [Euryarchaeota archaeon]